MSTWCRYLSELGLDCNKPIVEGVEVSIGILESKFQGYEKEE